MFTHPRDIIINSIYIYGKSKDPRKREQLRLLAGTIVRCPLNADGQLQNPSNNVIYKLVLEAFGTILVEIHEGDGATLKDIPEKSRANDIKKIIDLLQSLPDSYEDPLNDIKDNLHYDFWSWKETGSALHKVLQHVLEKINPTRFGSRERSDSAATGLSFPGTSEWPAAKSVATFAASSPEVVDLENQIAILKSQVAQVTKERDALMQQRNTLASGFYSLFTLRRSHPKKTRGVTGVSISKSTDAIKVDDSYNLTASTTKATISAEVKTAYALLQSLGWPSIISTEPKHTLGIPAAGALAEADAVSLITPY